MIQIVSIIAGFFNLASGGSYLKQLIKNESTPNPATWLIWVVITILNTTTYVFVVQESFWIAFTSIVLAIVIFIIFVTALSKGKFTQINKVDTVSLSLALLIGLYWWLTGNAVVANVALQAIFIISFYPTLHGVLVGTGKEKPTPWFLAVVSYVLQIGIVLTNPVTLWALTFPLINGIGNGVVGIAAYRQNKKDLPYKNHE